MPSGTATAKQVRGSSAGPRQAIRVNLACALTSRVAYKCPRSGGRVLVNRVRTVKVAALSDAMSRSGAPGALVRPP
jgi:hypothetical protein